MKTKYVIYIGRFKLMAFEAASLQEADKVLDRVGEEVKLGTCSLYQGSREMKNLCSEIQNSDEPISVKGGKARWKGIPAKDRSDEMKRIRAVALQNAAT